MAEFTIEQLRECLVQNVKSIPCQATLLKLGGEINQLDMKNEKHKLMQKDWQKFFAKLIIKASDFKNSFNEDFLKIIDTVTTLKNTDCTRSSEPLCKNGAKTYAKYVVIDKEQEWHGNMLDIYGYKNYPCIYTLDEECVKLKEMNKNKMKTLVKNLDNNRNDFIQQFDFFSRLNELEMEIAGLQSQLKNFDDDSRKEVYEYYKSFDETQPSPVQPSFDETQPSPVQPSNFHAYQEFAYSW